MFVVDIMVSLSPLLTRRDVLPFGQAPYDWLVHILGSAVPAFLVTAALHGSEGVRDLAARCLRWRVAVRWLVFALLGMPVAMLLYATAVYGAVPLTALAARWTLVFTQVLPLLVVLSCSPISLRRSASQGSCSPGSSSVTGRCGPAL